MIGNSISRRRWLAGSASALGVAIAVPAFVRPVLARPVLARDEVKKSADDVLTPAEILSRNDAVLQRIMLVYENGMRRVGDGEDIDPLVFSQCAEVARDFFHDYQEKAERDLVFPVFKKAGRMVELVDALIAQQVEGRKLTVRLLDAAPRMHAREQREAMGADIKAFIALYRPHLAREETDIFPTLHYLVTPDDYSRMAAELLQRQAAAFGQDGFEAAAKKVAQIETKIGMHDLAEAPAKK